jgi:peptidoglycan/xylan/chitin deacetylase (PgdA/CDA1 family)
VYIVPDFIDKLNYMFSWQIHALITSGLVEIGSHTMHHVNLEGLPYDRARTEIDQSKQTLEEQYGIRVNSFAYPFGAADGQAITLVKSAGYRTAVSSAPGVVIGRNNRYDLFRIRPYNRIGEELLSYLN